MFALPPTAPLHQSFVHHVFGRWAGRPSDTGQPVAGGTAGAVLAQDGALADDDQQPDLAQRVREVGEW